MRAPLIAAAPALMLTAVVADAAVLTPDHVVIVIEENLPTRELAPELAYLNSLLHQGANFTNSQGNSNHQGTARPSNYSPGLASNGRWGPQSQPPRDC